MTFRDVVRRLGARLRDRLGFAAAVGALVAAPVVAEAQQIVSTGQSFLSARLLLGEGRDGGVHEAGLMLDIAPGWKTYWRNPGEAGVPPQFDWSGSENLAELRVDWPRPVAFQSFGMTTLGYGGRVVLPLTVVAEDPAEPVRLRLSAMLGVCRDICVFEQANLSRLIGPGESGPEGWLIEAAQASVPPRAEDAGVSLTACRIAGAGTERQLSARISLPDGAQTDPMVVLEGPAESWFESQTVSHDGDELVVEATLAVFEAGAWIDRSDIRMTVLADAMSADIQGCRPAAG
ncbi:MAG: protein-disulfide reductase DsbD domain-containing protein [Pseudomonadota bacterium]